jgi:hypothetical protein
LVPPLVQAQALFPMLPEVLLQVPVPWQALLPGPLSVSACSPAQQGLPYIPSR